MLRFSYRNVGFTLIELLVVISIIALLIGILLPALASVRQRASAMKGTTQVRGIMQGMVAFAQSNRGHFPGLDGQGDLIPAFTGTNDDGSNPATRFLVMLEGNFFTGEYAISPLESKTAWTSTAVEIDGQHYSYAMLGLDMNSDGSADANQRVREWRDTLNSSAPTLGDRNTGADAVPGGDISSIHTTLDSGDWRGSVAWGDGHAGLEPAPTMDTRFGNGAMVEDDNLFALNNDANGDADRDAAWVYESANAMVGQ